MSPTIGKLAKALAGFQEKKIKIAKENEVDMKTFKYAYADLSTIIEKVTEGLAAEELSFAQFPTGKNGLKTILMHSSGEWIEEIMEMPPTTTAQAQGSAITYARRYALCAALGISPDKDDDGAAAQSQQSVTRGDFIPGDEPQVTYEDVPFPEPQEKICPKCGKHHAGKYPKCLDCWKKDNAK